MKIIETVIKWAYALVFNNEPDTIILHHAEASVCDIGDIDRWHKGRGWAGIGYHYFVRKDGSIYRGRPENAQGAHTKGYNTHSIGICAEGAYMRETMPEAQKKAIIWLCQDVIARHKIKAIYGHREVYATACPGTNYPLAEIKASVRAKKIEEIEKEDPVEKTWLQVGDEGTEVKTLQTKLINAGYKCGKYGADGSFGKDTKSAVMKFQNAHNLEDDGLAGTRTMAVLNKIKNIPYPKYCLKFNPKKYDGNVKLVQAKLGIKADGYFGKNTLTAVKTFQTKHHLAVDGKVGPITWVTLF